MCVPSGKDGEMWKNSNMDNSSFVHLQELLYSFLGIHMWPDDDMELLLEVTLGFYLKSPFAARWIQERPSQQP